MKLRKDLNCPVCGENPTVTELIDYQEFCGIPQANAQAQADEVPEITVQELEDACGTARRSPSSTCASRTSTRCEHRREAHPPPSCPSAWSSSTDETLAVHCKSGGRSARAVKLLKEAGFQNVYNVRGGIDAWSEEIDPSVPKY